MNYEQVKNLLRAKKYSEAVYPDNPSMKEFSTMPNKFGLCRYIFAYVYKHGTIMILDKKVKSYHGFEFHYETEKDELTEAINKEWKTLLSDLEDLKK